MLSHGICLILIHPEVQKIWLHTALKFAQHVRFIENYQIPVENVDAL
jgi:hypothetical protein